MHSNNVLARPSLACRHSFLIVAILSVTACATLPPHPAPATTVSYEAVADDSLPRYAAPEMGAVVLPTALAGNPAPRYPASRVADDAPAVVIEALLIVGADGDVREIRIPSPMATGSNADYALAVASATLNWHFEPLQISQWKERPDGSQYRISATPKPFSQRYSFRFAIVDGKPSVLAQ